MIVIKNRNDGFSLIEVVIALAMIGILVTAVFGLQQVLLERDIFNSERLQRMMLLKNALYDPSVMRPESVQEFREAVEIKEPKTRVTLKKESLKNNKLKNLKNLKNIRARATWSGLLDEEELQVDMLLFEEPKKEKKK